MPTVTFNPVPLKEITNQVLQFCESYSGIKFHPYQIQFANRVIESIVQNDGEEITALFSRQSGKTEAISVIAGGMAVILPFMARLPQYEPDKRMRRFKNGLWIGIFAPILEQSQTTFDRVRGRMNSELAKQIFSIPQMSVRFDSNNGNCVALNNGSMIMCMSASDNSHIESKTFHLIICEESQEISNSKLRKSIHPMGASTNATIVKIGTPWTRKGDFYDAIQRNKKRLLSENKKNHFEYDYQIAQKYNPLYAKYIEKEMNRLGYDSDEFRMSYRLHWILERGMAMAPDLLERLGKDYSGKTYDIVDVRRNSKQVAGLDLAKATDSTVLTIMEVDYNHVTAEGFYYKRILNWLELYGDDYESQFYQIRDFLANYNVEKMCVDSTGVGDPIADRLTASLPSIHVIPYKFSRPSKSDLYKYFLNDLYGERVRFPNTGNAQKLRRQRMFVQQMMDLEKRYEGEYLVCAHPDEKDAHDDFPDSAALANWAVREEDIPVMEMSAGAYGR
jgi:hypothetical protein